ncbi:acyl-CoA dehydratase activase [Desulfofustis glycolicus]|uniref:CoA-substrate-specific enzyme activase, putative n=1 Tax=Desulfofustis glycolicus DSM 9705 TaxID=1121409 RepID=A0A1M5SYV2_9BACT|nr:acyl-CoA dehydratase activase [Desulfofustis glycolicus]MCB2215271.1 3-hydroxyacyl-ACP dehydratase [Desulfobulbaceae bacterium]SHH43642.1 CoA-substrate-specific enzyme activase, putative [Desulfofustis glycolicus DSM 9705]
MTHYGGIDIGSRTIELVVVDEAGQVCASLQCDTGYDPLAATRSLIDAAPFDRIMATGYGRTLFEISFESRTVTEIKAHARGARALFGDAATIIDIGGQDSKAIALLENGRVKKFEMNDRCAAGTGKFLEIMARTLGFTIDDFGREALQAQNALTISSMCTVFAESEVTSLIAKGEDPRNIALGLHHSVIRRAAAMINRVSSAGDVVFTGGVARNPCMTELLAKQLGRRVLVPDEPQRIGALGAALLLMEEH